MSDVIVKCSNLKKDYETGDVIVPALRGIDLEIPTGSFIVILGPSGCGKTTLLNVIGGIDIATEGKIIINGDTNITSFSESQLTNYRKEDIGFIFQFYNLIPTLTAIENIELAAKLKFPKKSYEKSLEMLKAVGMEHKENSFPSQLSGGEQQRIAIARALVKEPKIVLADEPTGNLDTVASEKILNLMMKINKERRTTFLIVTHNTAISKLADRVVYLTDGKIFGISEG